MLGHTNGITVYLVDGGYVRSHTDIEFTDFGQHYRYHYIPENEFWIDNNTPKEEWHAFVKHLTTEYNLMKSGLSYDKALPLADKAEKGQSPTEALDKKPLGHNVFTVNGEFIRNTFRPDFVEGGHGLVYNWIPKDEVWLERSLSEAERFFVLAHELYEHSLMKTGMPYDKAHEKASVYELKLRELPMKKLV